MADRYEMDGTYVKNATHNRRLLQIDGNFIKDVSRNRRLLQVDGNFIKNPSTNWRMLEIVRGNDIKDIATNKVVGKVGGDSVTINGRSVEVKGMGRLNAAFCVLIALALLDSMV